MERNSRLMTDVLRPLNEPKLYISDGRTGQGKRWGRWRERRRVGGSSIAATKRSPSKKTPLPNSFPQAVAKMYRKSSGEAIRTRSVPNADYGTELAPQRPHSSTQLKSNHSGSPRRSSSVEGPLGYLTILQQWSSLW